MNIWSSPVLPADQYVIWSGCGYLDPAYYTATINPKTGLGSVHPGDDFNIRTGGNTDEGKPLYAMSDAIITHAKAHRVWGNIVLARCDYGPIWWQIAHLKMMSVKVGDHVRAGDQIGTIGRGGQRPDGSFYYYAHAHTEIRIADLPADEWPSTTMGRAQAEAYIARTRKAPGKFLAEMGAARTFEELAALRAQAEIVRPSGLIVPSYWKNVLDPVSGHGIAGLWVSEEHIGKPYRVPVEELKKRGLN